MRILSRSVHRHLLDPACGTGNSPLYVAMARMKLEGEVLDLLVDLGDDH